jgi:hypothetical protein
LVRESVGLATPDRSTALDGPTAFDGPRRAAALAPTEAVALVARARRELLLAAHRHRLAPEELEDCYSQATFELLKRAGRGDAFSSRAHIANALEQRFLSRIHDRRRALSGRSPIEAAIATAVSLDDGGVEIADPRADVERLALLREQLRRIGEISRELSTDQLLLLRSQLSCDMACGEFCRTHGWSEEKYRKVAQRARARLTRLLDESLGHSDLSVPVADGGRIREQGPIYDNPSPHT